MKKRYEEDVPEILEVLEMPEMVCEDGACEVPSVGKTATKKVLSAVWVRDKEGNQLYILSQDSEVTVLNYDGDRAMIAEGEYVKAEFLG